MTVAEVWLVSFGALTALTTVLTVVFKAGGVVQRLDAVESRLTELERAVTRSGVNFRKQIE